MRYDRWRGERGQAIAWVAVFLPALLVVLGLVVDGGLAFAARRDLQDLADGAAAAGAMQIDQTTFVTSGAVQTDSAHAQTAALSYLASHPEVGADVKAGTNSVQVTVRETYTPVFLRLFGVRTVNLAATATADARIGH
jgi:uncharacterized membrane protein